MEWITDRMEADVLMGNKKGNYSSTDLNRVEQAVQMLSSQAERLDIHFLPQIKADWGLPSAFSSGQWPVKSQMERYLKNIRGLCSAAAVAADLPGSMESLNWEGANQIERALREVEEQIQNVLLTFGYSGELYAGEEIGI